MHEQSPLIELPAELRNNIYRKALLRDGEISVSSKESPDEPALLATCRQIRSEVLPIYYGENNFVAVIRVLQGPRLSAIDVNERLTALTDERSKLIKRLRVCLEPKDEILQRNLSASSAELWLDIARKEGWDLWCNIARSHQQGWAAVGLELSAIRFSAPDAAATNGYELSQLYKEAAEHVLRDSGSAKYSR